MNRNLNPQLFSSEAYEVPGPHRSEVSPSVEQPEILQKSAHGGFKDWPRSGDSPSNPLHTESSGHVWDEVGDRLEYVSFPVRREWVPTADMQSPQTHVSTGAVTAFTDHPGYPPAIEAVRSDGNLHVFDGNHRANAAQRQGRLIMGADVFDRDLWRLTEGW